MENEKQDKRVPVKIAGWPWWLEQPYLGWGWVIGVVVVGFSSVLVRGRRLGNLIVLVVGVAFLIGVVWLLNWAVDWFLGFLFEGFPARGEDLPAAICPKCRYDLRATLMRCPECGSDTPFKMWLEKQNPLERYLFQKYLERHPHEPEKTSGDRRPD